MPKHLHTRGGIPEEDAAAERTGRRRHRRRRGRGRLRVVLVLVVSVCLALILLLAFLLLRRLDRASYSGERPAEASAQTARQESAPFVGGVSPAFGEEPPRTDETVPQAEESGPTASEPAPRAEENAPQEGEETSQPAAAAPPVEEELPPLDVTAPEAVRIIEAGRPFRRIAASTENSAWIDGQRASVIGSNQYGQCDTSSWPALEMICLGDAHAVGLTADGQLVFAGSDERRQLELDTEGREIRSIAAGPYASYAVLTDGTARVSGDSPVTNAELKAERGLLAIRASSSHVVLLYADGTVSARGADRFGECAVDDWRDIVLVDCGYGFTVGLDAAGTVHVAGDRDKIQLDGFTDAKGLAAGANNCFVIRSDGTVFGAGYNGGGQMNTQLWTDVQAVAAGYMHTVGVNAAGEHLTAGSNDSGQLQ